MTDATGDGLAWTRAQRRKLHGPLRPHPLDPRDRTPDRDACWQTLLARFRDNAPLRRPAAGATPALRDAIARVYASFESGRAPAALDGDDECVRSVLMSSEQDNPPPEDPALARALVGFWSGVAGAAFAVRMLARETWFSVRANYTPGMSFHLEFEQPSAEWRAFPVAREGWWAALRPYVLALDPAGEAYAAARAEAESMRARMPYHPGCTMAFARERQWAAEDAREGAAQVEDGTRWSVSWCWPAFASLADPALAERLAVAAARPPRVEGYAHVNYTRFAAPYALDLVDALGPAAARPLTILLEGAGLAPVRRAFAEALVLADPDAARATLTQLQTNSPAHVALAAALEK